MRENLGSRLDHAKEHVWLNDRLRSRWTARFWKELFQADIDIAIT
jgi:hypothetical protein